ncbi:hypothetical protein SDC9_174798 [bioreactor metagenome]|uniref:Uncharacterized protein n=1 Tax=bioreactor metagenome TaxID=1076179 RepID=A0A645GKE9_9ZZZZ
MIYDFTFGIFNIFSQMTTYDTVTQGFNNCLVILTFSYSLHFNTFDSVVADLNLTNFTARKNSIYCSFIKDCSFFGHYFAISSYNIFCQWFAKEMMHHVFFKHFVNSFLADIDLHAFSSFAVKIISCIKGNFHNFSSINFI